MIGAFCSSLGEGDSGQAIRSGAGHFEIIPSVDTFEATNGSRRSRYSPPFAGLSLLTGKTTPLTRRSYGSLRGSADFVCAASGTAPAAYVGATADQLPGFSQINGAPPRPHISKLTPDQTL